MSTTSRVLKNTKTIKLVFQNVAADGMLADSQGNTEFALDDINWQRIVFHGTVDAITGTSVTFKVVTGSDPNVPLATTSLAGTNGAGTAIASASITSTGVFGFAATKRASDGSTASNIGQKFGVWADVNTITDLDGSIVVYIEGQ